MTETVWITGVRLLDNPDLVDIGMAAGKISAVLPCSRSHPEKQVIDASGLTAVPTAVDCHVHSRDPGFPDKETWRTLTAACGHGGVTGVVDMPNTMPQTVDRHGLDAKMSRIAGSWLDYRILMGVSAQTSFADLVEVLEQPDLPVCGLKIYLGQSTGNMQSDDFGALDRLIGPLAGRPIVFHCEDQCRMDSQLSAVDSTQLDTQNYQIHSVIRDSQAAVLATRRVLQWAAPRQQPVHIAHVSTPDEMAEIADARDRGVAVTAEVCPHHLLFTDRDYERFGSLIKVNPPVRSIAEVEKLRQFFQSGQVDCFGTDHAPHTLAEKSLPYRSCPSGISSIDFFVPAFAACLRDWQDLSAWRMVNTNPAKLFGFDIPDKIEAGSDASFSLVAEHSDSSSPEQVFSGCGWSPYQQLTLPIRVLATVQRGVFRYNRLADQPAPKE